MPYKQRKIKSERRILFFRILTVISLICTGVFAATFGYLLLNNGENDFYSRQYNSLTNGMYRTLLDGVDARNSAGRSFAAAFGGYCPDSTDWPNCWIPYNVFEGITTSLGVTLNMILPGILPILKPDQVPAFEDFAQEVFINESFPTSTGNRSGEFGIFSVNRTTGKLYHDTTGMNDFNPYDVLIPFFQYYKHFWTVIMYNALSSESVALPLNELITCSRLQIQCNASVSDIFNLRVNDELTPATVMFLPVVPVNNQSDLVGFVSIFISWPDVLEAGAPSVLSNIYAVLSSGTTEITFLFKNGHARFYDNGDKHDQKFNHKRKKFDFSLTGTGVSSFNYSITLYPAQQFYDTYHTQTPFYVCLVSLLIVLGTSFIFLIYDFFVKREAIEQTRILEAKQTYVRFISHVSIL